MCYLVSMKARPPRPRSAARGSDSAASGRARVNWNTVLLEQIRLAGLPEPIPE